MGNNSDIVRRISSDVVQPNEPTFDLELSQPDITYVGAEFDTLVTIEADLGLSFNKARSPKQPPSCMVATFTAPYNDLISSSITTCDFRRNQSRLRDWKSLSCFCDTFSILLWALVIAEFVFCFKAPFYRKMLALQAHCLAPFQ